MAKGRAQMSGEESPDIIAAREWAAQKAADAAPVAAGVVLARNFGIIDRGRSLFWAAGTRFDPIADRELISRLARAGASFV